ncbi:MAG: GAF domain-containing protein [Blastochloris sp.]|nr:GAF domain-containing protein [Blastochloris sp.]
MAVRLDDGVAISFSDISARKHIEHALRDAEERLRSIVDSAKDYAIFALDTEGHIETWNAGAERVFGYSEAEVLGQPGRIVYTPDDQQAGIFENEMRRAADVGAAEDERWHQRKDGSRFFASGVVRPIRDEAGTLRGFTKVARDATTRKIAENRTELLQKLAAKLSAQLTPQEMAASITSAIPEAVGEAVTSVFLLLPDDQGLERLHTSGMPPEHQFQVQRVPMTTPWPAIDAVRTGEIVWVGSREDYDVRYPSLKPQLRQYGIHATIAIPLVLDDEVLGSIAVLFHFAKVLSDQERELLIAIAHLCAQALQRARLFEAEQRATQEAALRAERLMRLQSVTTRLSQLLTLPDVARAIIDEGVATFGAATGAINLLEDENTFVVVYTSTTHLSPQERQHWQRFPATRALMAGDAIHRLEPLWLEDAAQVLAAYPAMARFTQIYTGAWVMLPLVLEGRGLGVIGFAFTEARRFDDEERRFMVALAQQCAQAIERARLYEAEREAREMAQKSAHRIAQLQEITALFSEALTPEQVAQVVVQKGILLLGGHVGAIAILDEENQQAVLLNQYQVHEDIVKQFARIPLEARFPLTDAIRLGEPIWISTQDEYISRYPGIKDVLALTQSHANATSPLIANGRVIGGFGLSFSAPNPFSDEDRELLVALARLCASALERARLYAQEQQARRAAEEADALKMQFLGMISHELRTPLASIKGFTGTLLLDDVTFPPEQQRQFLHIMEDEADRLTGLVEQLLDLSRLQAGTLRIEPVPQPVRAILDAARAQLDSLTHRHQFLIQVPDDLPFVLADSERIAQVLVNLVGNAAKFSQPGTSITLNASAHQGSVQFDVQDEGVGIPHDEHKRVFEAFRQSERKHPSQRIGAGLGLAICKGIIEAHEGRIWVQDQVAGTTISFVLPQIAPPRPE